MCDENDDPAASGSRPAEHDRFNAAVHDAWRQAFMSADPADVAQMPGILRAVDDVVSEAIVAWAREIAARIRARTDTQSLEQARAAHALIGRYGNGAPAQANSRPVTARILDFPAPRGRKTR